MLENYWFILILYSLICAGLSSFLGVTKNRSGTNWFWCGLLFGVLGLITAVGVPSKEEVLGKEEVSDKEEIPSKEYFCSECKDSIKYTDNDGYLGKTIAGNLYCNDCADKL